MPIQTTNGKTVVNHKEIAATGQARVQFSIVIFLGIVLLLLTVTYMYLVINGRESSSLLTFLGTAYGLAVGIVTSRHSS